MIVITDTTPLNYLVLIDCVGILPQLYGRVLIPPSTHDLRFTPILRPIAQKMYTRGS